METGWSCPSTSTCICQVPLCTCLWLYDSINNPESFLYRMFVWASQHQESEASKVSPITALELTEYDAEKEMI